MVSRGSGGGPKDDHTDYPADEGDGDDEPSDDDDDDNDDTDDEDEEPFKDEDDDKEEEEHLAPADSFAIPIIRLRRARKTVRLEPPMSVSIEAYITEHVAAPTPPLPVASPLLPLPSPLTTSPTDAGAPLGYRRACLTTLAPGLEIGESLAAGAARQPRTTIEADLRRYRVMEIGYGITDTWDEIVEAMLENEEFQVPLKDAQDDQAYLRARVNTVFRDRPYPRHTAMILDREVMYARIAWTSSEDRSATIEAHTQLTTSLGRIETLEARDPEPQDEPAEAGSSCVAAVLAEHDADRSRNGDDSHDSGTGERRQASTVRACTYTDFLKCQPMNFKGTKGVVRLTKWLEKMESVFYICNCTVACQVKFATYTLQGNALTWWNSYARAVGHDIAYAMPWKTLKKMMTDKYYPRGEIKKLETEMWNLKVKGTDVMSYNQRFQELVLVCDRMFPEESDVVEKYVSGLPDMIHGSVKASKPKTMQEAIEFGTKLVD
ncbi:putative reverse transcriptase domain-containing protein [Tanacetum coccineum]